MKVELLDEAVDDLDKMDNSVFLLFDTHLKILADIPHQRHLKHGLNFYVKDLKQKKYKIVYTIEDDTINVLRCFDDHKKYDKWLRAMERKGKRIKNKNS